MTAIHSEGATVDRCAVCPRLSSPKGPLKVSDGRLAKFPGTIPKRSVSGGTSLVVHGLVCDVGIPNDQVRRTTGCRPLPEYHRRLRLNERHLCRLIEVYSRSAQHKPVRKEEGSSVIDKARRVCVI